MGHEIEHLTGIPLATCVGKEIPEVGVADGALDDENVHVGVNIMIKAPGGIDVDKLDDRFPFVNCPPIATGLG